MEQNKIHLPTYFERKAAQEEKKYKILIFSGSPRSKKNCAGEEGKSLELAKLAIEHLSDNVEAELIDLAKEKDELTILPCNGCISTAGGYHCHFPCSCYSKAKKDDPVKDLMYEYDIYNKLLNCDGFIVYTPINWYAVSTPIKAMFDRLVCISNTLPAELGMKEFGKDPKKSIPAYEEGIYDNQLKNWLEGKYAAFFIHGDDGADDEKRLSLPASFVKDYDIEANDPYQCIMPIVAACRYSGIFVPDDLIIGLQMNKGLSYAEGNQKFKDNLEEVKEKAMDLANRLIKYIQRA